MSMLSRLITHYIILRYSNIIVLQEQINNKFFKKKELLKNNYIYPCSGESKSKSYTKEIKTIVM